MGQTTHQVHELEAGVARLEQLAREREALAASYGELTEAMVSLGAAARAGRVSPMRPELQDVLMRLVRTVEAERDHAESVWELLLDAYDSGLTH